MAFSKPVDFTIQEPKVIQLTFHDIIAISWTFSTGQVLVTVGSWLDKESWANKESPMNQTQVMYSGAELFDNVSAIIDTIIADQEGLFGGGTKDGKNI